MKHTIVYEELSEVCDFPSFSWKATRMQTIGLANHRFRNARKRQQRPKSLRTCLWVASGIGVIMTGPLSPGLEAPKHPFGLLPDSARVSGPKFLAAGGGGGGGVPRLASS